MLPGNGEISRNTVKPTKHILISSCHRKVWIPRDPRNEREIAPEPREGDEMEVRAQSEVQLQEIHLLEEDEAAAIRLLQQRGIIPGDFDPTNPTTRVAERQAMRAGLDMKVRTEAARILHQRAVNPAAGPLIAGILDEIIL